MHKAIVLNKTDIAVLMAVDGEKRIKNRTNRHDKSIRKLVNAGILVLGIDYCLYLVSLKGVQIAAHARA
jgi:hypothetical protein